MVPRGIIARILFAFLIIGYAGISSAEYDLCSNGTEALLALSPTSERDIGLKATVLSRAQRDAESAQLLKKLVVISDRLNSQMQARIWAEKQLYLAMRKCYLDY